MSAPVLAVETPVEGMTRAEWLALRQTGLGGSDVAAIAGMSAWRTPLAVWLEKVGMFVPDDEPSEYMEWGTLLEPVVADEFSRRTGVPTEEHRALLRHPDHGHLIANIDRRIIRDPRLGVDAPGVYEGKCTDARNWADWAHDRVPDYAALQTHHYLAVTGWSYAYVTVLIGGNRLEWRRVERDDDLIAHLLRIEADFWRRVVEHDPPPPEPADAQLLGRVWTPDPEKAVMLDDAGLALLAEREAAKAAEKEAGDRAKRAQAELELLLADREYGLDEYGEIVCSWRQIAPSHVEAHDRAAYRRFLAHKPKRAGR